MRKLKIDLGLRLKRLEIGTKGLVSSRFLGNYKSVFKGKGLEFDGYRNYGAGDDASLIDWKASSRSPNVLVKEYVEERDMEIIFLIDASSTMILGSTPKLKAEYASELVASLSYAMLSSEDRVGLIFFTDKVVKKVSSDKGVSHFYVLSEALVNSELYGGVFNLKEALKYALQSLGASTLLIILSDFVAMPQDVNEEIKLASKKFDVIGMMIRDPRDITLPESMGQIVLSDPNTHQAIIVEPGKIKESYAQETQKEINAIKSFFLSNGNDFIELTTDKPFLNTITGLFRRRAEKWR